MKQTYSEKRMQKTTSLSEKQLEQRRNAGKALVNKYGVEYMQTIGRKGAKVFHDRYYVQPYGIKGWVIVGRKDNKIKQITD